MSHELTSLVEEYRTVTEPGATTPGDGSLVDFYRIRSDIAGVMADGQTAPDEAFAIPDSTYIASNRAALPGLAETIATTKRIDGVVETLTVALGTAASAVIINGSANWGRNYSVYGSNGKSSDVDVDVIFGDPSDALVLHKPELIRELELFEGYAAVGKAAMFMSKTDIDGVTASLHYIPAAQLDNVLSYPYKESKEPFELRAFRTSLPNRPIQQYGPTYNFAHDSYFYNLRPEALEGGFTTGQPFMMVGSSGEFVMAPSLHKLAVLSDVRGHAVPALQVGLDGILSQLADRKHLDAPRLEGEPSFAKLIARYDRMPHAFQNRITSLDAV